MGKKMSLVSNVTSMASVDLRRQGAVLHSVATIQQYRVSYGVQSATFIRTVAPGQATGTYRLNGMIPTWQGAQITADFRPTGSSRAAGSPPVPYPPKNASAYYSPAHTRIVPNLGAGIYG